MRAIKQWIWRARWIGLFAASILLVVLVTDLGADRNQDLLKHSVKFQMPFVDETVGFPSRLVGDSVFLLTCRTNHTVTAILYNPLTGTKTTISNIGETLSNCASKNWQIYAHSNWIVLDSISETNFVSFLFEFNNPLIVTNSSYGFSLGDLFWMPTELAWLRISGHKSKIEQIKSTKEIVINSRFRPEFPVGFITNYVFASATNGLVFPDKSDLPYPKILSLEYWHLDTAATLLAVKQVIINGDNIISGLASQQGDRIIWICYHKLMLPKLNISTELFSQRYEIRLYISSNKADHFHCIGSIPSITDFPHVQWLPDGTGICFEYKGSWYLYHFDHTNYQNNWLGQVTNGARYWNDGTPVAGQQYQYQFDNIGNWFQTRSGGDTNGANLRPANYSVNSLNQITQRDVSDAEREEHEL